MKTFFKTRSTCVFSSITLLFFALLLLFTFVILAIEENKRHIIVIISALFIPFVGYATFWILQIINVCAYIKFKQNNYKLMFILLNIFAPFLHFIFALIFWKKLFLIELNEEEMQKRNSLSYIKKWSIWLFSIWIICIIGIIINSIFEIKYLTTLSIYDFFNVTSAIVIISSVILIFIFSSIICSEIKLLNKNVSKKIKIISYIPLINSIVWTLIK